MMPVPPISFAKEGKMGEFQCPDEYLLKWRQHNPQLLSQVSQYTFSISIFTFLCILKFLEMRKDESFTDVTIATEKKIFQVENFF